MCGNHAGDLLGRLVQARVEAAGGQILFWNGVRVMGVLAVSRAIGDHCLRPFVIAQPEVSHSFLKLVKSPRKSNHKHPAVSNQSLRISLAAWTWLLGWCARPSNGKPLKAALAVLHKGLQSVTVSCLSCPSSILHHIVMAACFTAFKAKLP